MFGKKTNKKSKVKKFQDFVEKKTQKILSKKIPEPKFLNKKVVEADTTKLALNEMQKFKKAHDRPPTKEELDKIAESIYKQIKSAAEKKERHNKKSRKSILEERKKRREKDKGKPSEKKENDSIAQKRRRQRHGRPGKEKEVDTSMQAPEIGERPLDDSTKKDLEGMSVTDIFSNEKNSNDPVEDVMGKDDFGNLEKELAGLEKGSDSISKEIKTDKNKCPNCKNFAQDLVFCPECGTAFCSHCAKKVETAKDYSKFTCPKCKKTFKSKKV